VNPRGEHRRERHPLAESRKAAPRGYREGKRTAGRACGRLPARDDKTAVDPSDNAPTPRRQPLPSFEPKKPRARSRSQRRPSPGMTSPPVGTGRRCFGVCWRPVANNDRPLFLQWSPRLRHRSEPPETESSNAASRWASGGRDRTVSLGDNPDLRAVGPDPTTQTEEARIPRRLRSCT
jgi:hypothetical protein